MSDLLCIGTAKGVRGNVYAEDGTLIGRVFKQSRRLRETGGKFGEAWTAVATTPDGEQAGASLGTRHPDRWHAARAIQAFWGEYPAARIDRMVSEYDLRNAAMWHPGDGFASHKARAWRSALGRAVSIFKYDSHETCGLTARYRGADPRRDYTISDRLLWASTIAAA